MTTEFTPLVGLAGGVLIGLSAVLLMLGSGRIAGISGIFAGMLAMAPRTEKLWRAVFIAGILVGAEIAALAGLYSADALSFQPMLLVVVAASFLVGIGTQLGSGCTSGHGVCGLARLSGRSLAATTTFMAIAIVVVFITRHVL
jgi:uncharacterized membrane protein YedE/YeeE